MSLVALETSSPLIQATAALVREQFKANDASHDWDHIERVWTLARAIAREENVAEENLKIVDLAALLHDIDDYKYETEDGPKVRALHFLESQNVPSETIARVMAIIDNLGFKEELGGQPQREATVEFGCVQDADRLDAIGAIGVARCFTYGGHVKRALYDSREPPTDTDITQEQYMQQTSASIDIFYQKLFKLRERMKTDAGRRIAEERHAFMETFVAQFYKEINGRE
ncbi:Hd repeat domain-containing protein [Globisporangium polare]